MRIVMTLMVRDEVDVIRPMIEHSLAQGVDRIVATDNGSVDGTTEVLEEFARDGVVDLRHDPVHRKQQGERVTQMARDAATVHGADWVVNADADEFWLPVDRGLRLRDALEMTPLDVRTFTAPVVDMIGAPAASGTGFGRLVHRDERPIERMRELGVHAHATPDAVHVGDPDVVVQQGNHFTNLRQEAQQPAEAAIEVLHLPWRSWEQFSRKVQQAGRAYRDNPTLRPSPNHHGMREWRRAEAGTLLGWYLARHPGAEELAAGVVDGTLREDRALDHLVGVADAPLDAADLAFGAAVAPYLLESAEAFERARDTSAELAAARRSIADLEHERDVTRDRLVAMSRRRIVRIADGVARIARRSR